MTVKITGGGGGGGLGTDWPHLSQGTFPGGLDLNYLPGDGEILGATAFGLGFIRAVPFLARRTGQINRLGFLQTAAGGAGSLTRFAAYRSLATFYPGSLVVDSGDIATDGANGFKSIVTTFGVSRGEILWLAHQVGVAAPTIQSVTTAIHDLLGLSTVPADNSVLFIGAAYAAFPVIFPAGGAVAAPPLPAIFVRYT